ncbi:substrate-binding domain-containing protein [Amphibiibacter pelophylacis]|uniref:Substrate-binding domain-containing protein n=1 Tax=Amphibiibacter pelophylacis TaxID=1799477 RepID=A0ACC6P014_9BURK
MKTSEIPAALRGISSMATRRLLADLARAWGTVGGVALQIESVGGVEAARRVVAGEAFDLIFLASDALERLDASGHLLPGSRVDLARSGVVVAVAAGAPLPRLDSAATLREAVRAAPSVGVSTGPSGAALTQLFARWGLLDEIQPRLVTAPPGTPVGELVARGEVSLGFQQRAELIHLEGLTLADLPPDAQITTVFGGAMARHSPHAALGREVLAFMAAPGTAEAKRRQGMDAA